MNYIAIHCYFAKAYNQLNYHIWTQHAFLLHREVKVEIISFYRSPWGIHELKPRGQVDIGISKSFGRFALQASLEDIFNMKDDK